MKMKKYAASVFLAGLAGIVILFFYLSAACWGNLDWSRENIMFCMDESVSENQAVLMVEQHLERLEENFHDREEQEEIPGFCIWGQKEQVLLKNEELSRSIQRDVIIFCGAPELLFEECRVPGWEDRRGCLVDEETAWELFGSKEAEGQEITYEGNTYIIRKVISGKSGIAAFPAAEREQDAGKEVPAEEERFPLMQPEEKNLNRVTIKKPESQSVSELQTGWSGWSGMRIQILDLELLRGLGGFCVLLFPVTLCSIFLFCLCSQYRREKGWKARAGMLGFVLGFILTALFLSGTWVQIPDDYIPAKWSDFEFWSRLLEQKINAAKLLSKIPKSTVDFGWLTDFWKCTVSGILAEILAVLLLFSWKCSKIEFMFRKSDRRIWD